MKHTLAVLLVAGALAFAAGCGSPQPIGGAVSREDINALKFEIDFLQYILQQTKPTGINILDVDWKPDSRELVVKLVASGPEHQFFDHDTFAHFMSQVFFKKRYAESDHIRIHFIGTDLKLYKEYFDFDKFAKE
jgi:hypothetical protein